ncbi:dipeptide ABC transporter ATP-binding protein [Actinomyces weissii]|uniref:ABC transporter ATP-binding protein n=1 Tax=Actinomyces weissii TaxID=675090 RepID=A0A7T7S295_9ACTO|nr:ABC transporter ATP-binding protein [Actinomyces weissii]QQM67455.1 ABC transporter ATP-binding protein [Actinomyces weissii]
MGGQQPTDRLEPGPGGREARPAQDDGLTQVGPPAALRLRGLTVTFDGAPRPASAQVDLDLRPGRVLALVGESGSGKSVTALGALGLLPAAATVTGSARVLDPRQAPGASTGPADHGAGAARRAASAEAAGARQGGTVRDQAHLELVGADRTVLDQVRGRLVGTVFQEPTTALDPLETVSAQVVEAVRAHRGPDGSRPGRRQARKRVRELLQRVGLGDGEVVERIARSYPHQLSGGQLQRVCIALALAADPPVLIADEPTTALDVTVQAGILDLLRSLTQDGVAVLLITHDMGVVADVADEVAVMRHGQVVERGPVRHLFASPSHPYTRALLEAVPRLDAVRESVSLGRVARIVASGPETAAAEESRQHVTGGLAGRLSGASPAPGREGVGAGLEPVVEVHGLNVVYRSRRRQVHAVQDVSLHIDPGEVLGLVGESGSGKSTIAGTLMGLVPVASGSVRVCGVEVAGARSRHLLPARRATGVVYQNPASALNPRRTVGASIAEPLVLHAGMEPQQRRARVRELLEAVRLPARMADRYPHEMSGGQRQRVALARALALGPRLVVADEPTSALDVSVQAVVLELLSQLQQDLGFACLFVSHDLAVVESVAARTVVLSAGRVVEQGPTRQVLSAPQEDYTRRLVAAVPVPDPVLQAQRCRLRGG